MMEKIFELGERRRVTLEVWLATGETIPLENAAWTLTPCGGAEEASGTCETEQDGTRWRLTAEVQPETRRLYDLQYGFSMGSELVRRTVRIRVV